MDEQAKKTALRMIPYGLYVLTAENKDGAVSAATVNWVTQTSFSPPLVAVGVKKDSGSHALIQEAQVFALNMLGKDQAELAYKFFKPQERDGNTIAGEAFEPSPLGAPILQRTPAWVECKLSQVVDIGDHAIFVGEVTEAAVRSEIEGRPDDAILWLKDLGEKVFYGG